MKRLAAALGLLAVLVFAGCQVPFFTTGQATDEAVFVLPSDSVRDVPRSFSGQFTFETLLPVELALDLVLYGRDDDGNLVGDPLDPAAHSVTATVTTVSDRLLYKGPVSPDGTLRTEIYLPSAPQDLILTLSAPGFETRSVTLSSAVSYSRIARTMALSAQHFPEMSMRSLIGEPDPVYVQNVPAEGVLTIAFEDLFRRANAGDADYNDFVAEYRIQEFSEEGGITRIRVDAKAKVKLAGYNHRFGIRIDEFEGEATLTGEYIDEDGFLAEILNDDGTERVVSGSAEVILFEDSSKAVGEGKEAWFEIAFSLPQARTGDGGLSAPPYNPYVIVINTGFDIHLIGRPAIDGSENPGDPFVDAKGFPWALLVPTDWVHPAEGRRIDSDAWYPRFTNWRLSGGTEHTDWYNWLGQPYVPDPGNQPPYPVTGPTQTPTFTAFTSADQFYQLEIAEVDGQRDPDGDQVFFRSTTLPDYMLLDADTGLVTILGDPTFAGPPAGEVVVEFWSEDEHGADTSGTPYVVTFTFEST